MNNSCKRTTSATRWFFLLMIILPGISLYAQKEITVESFTSRNAFIQRSVTGINWMSDGKYYSSLRENKVIKYDITTGQPVETLVDGNTLSIRINGYSFSQDEKQMLLQTEFESIYRRSYKAVYFIYDRQSNSLQRLSEGKQSYATFSPDGGKVAFTRDNNLFYVDIKNKNEIQVTSDGKFNHIINGSTDWVYEEEFSFTKAFDWSPDSRHLAYYRFDEGDVKEYNLQLWGSNQLYPEDYRFKYPKAGEKNSTIEVWFHNLESSKKIKADLGPEQDIYLPRVQWTKNNALLSVMKLNRLQNELTIYHIHAHTGVATQILQEKSSTFIDMNYVDDFFYLNDGKHFVRSSEQNGYKHIYLYTTDGKLVRQITQGNYEVTKLIGLDEKTKTLYYQSTEASPLERHFYSIGLDGKKKARLTQSAGTHTINMSSDFQFYINYFSSATQPQTVTLFRTKGNTSIKVLETNESLAKTVEEYGLAAKEFFTFKTNDGSLLHGLYLKPKDFDATKKYPVLLYQYSGPGSQNVSNAWGGGHFYFHQMMVQRGYIVAIVDTRGTGFRGEQFKKMTYKQLGKYELEDLVEAAKFLGSQSFVDGARIGIWGWSYGGYMSSLAMTKSPGVFRVGIAVAPVTNWRFYDTVYTERYLQLPQTNASGYDDNSPSTHAANLQGKFLLVHGTGDDNVHFQNSVVLQDALINAGKQFDTFYYPDKNHGLSPGIKSRQHLYNMMADYLLKNL